MSGTDTFMKQVIASLARSRPFGETSTAAYASHLLAEDRPDYERLVDDVLRDHPAGPDEPLTPGQVRTMAVNAASLISSAAAPEYLEYVRRREAGRPTEAGDEAAEAGAPAVVMVLAPVLAGTAAVGFLGVGYGLRLVNGDSDFVRTLISTGWVFGAITVAAILVGAVALLLTAVRNSTYGPAAPDVAAARETWLAALRERGVEPFVREVRRAVPGPPGEPGAGG
ncbi:hypothetical protein [Streptomyces sp. TLI_146]|uniref:hypothetical protein n=1 Tax=Streptomyces sp. TLI_146 TaxID=1938858 RepID=UPI000CB50182|nr:hypothetical protein [Streptomyces sp. TLI_146]PKV85431.1 hypothetical protein BX283_2967 [Streptomyces sp. TLI_146]